jgi:hypothetical protein
MTNATDSVLFHEVQHLRQWWAWLLILIPAVISWYSFILQIVLGQRFGNNPAPDVVVWIIWLIFGIGFLLLFNSTKLTTEVRRNSIFIGLFPFYSRTIPLHDVLMYKEARRRTMMPPQRHLPVVFFFVRCTTISTVRSESSEGGGSDSPPGRNAPTR